MHLKDSSKRYGWLSIALHWTGAVAVVMLWFIGNVMTSEGTRQEDYTELVRVHTSVAVAVYLLLLGRIVHRFAVGFPGPFEDQHPLRSLGARLVQYSLLIGIGTMLLSGPLMVWANGDTIGVFNWGGVPSPFAPSPALHELMAATHRTTRWALLIAVLVHVGGIFLSRGETLNRMLPAPEVDADAPARPDEAFTDD